MDYKKWHAFSQIIHFPADDFNANGNGFATGNNGNSGFAAFSNLNSNANAANSFNGNGNANVFSGNPFNSNNVFNAEPGLSAPSGNFGVDNGLGAGETVGTLQQQLITETHGKLPLIRAILGFCCFHRWVDLYTELMRGRGRFLNFSDAPIQGKTIFLYFLR